MWPRISQRLEPFQDTIWTVFTPLAIKNQAVNLGQGFPSYSCPDFVKEALKAAVDNNENQYARAQGTLPLVERLASLFTQKHKRPIDPLSELVVTHGASEALLCGIMGNVNPGDEVVLVEPFFDMYVPPVSMAGGVIRSVPLHAPAKGSHQWTLDFDALEKAFTPKTRLFIFNNPQNPVGKCYSSEELQAIADILAKWPKVSILSDEVYDHLVFDDREHHYLCDYNDLWERTATLNSGGKIFSVTGWKVGWARGGPKIIKNIATARLWTTFCPNTVCEGAIERSLAVAEQPYQGFPNYYAYIQQEYQAKRERVVQLLNGAKKVNLDMLVPEGGYFACGFFDKEQVPESYLAKDLADFAFAKWLTETHKVTCIPCSAFYSEQYKELGAGLARFALCRTEAEYAKTEELLS